MGVDKYRLAMARIIAAGYTISISPEAMVTGRYGDFSDLIPLGNLTLESDGPWKYDGIRGGPSMIEDTAAFLAARRDLSPEEILGANYQNSGKLFGENKMI